MTRDDQILRYAAATIGAIAAIAVAPQVAAGANGVQVKPQVKAQVVQAQVVRSQVVKPQLVKAQIVKAQRVSVYKISILRKH